MALFVFLLFDAIIGLAAGGLAAEFHAERFVVPLLSSLHLQQTAHPSPSSLAPRGRSILKATLSPDNVEASDSFQREDAPYWGDAPDGRWRWGADANSSTAFSIRGETGVISGSGAFTATLGPSLHNSEVTFTGSINAFTDGSNMGTVLRWIDADEWYKAYIDGTHFVVIKRRGTLTTILGSVIFPAKAGERYTLKFRSTGEQFQAKVWQQGTIEPGWLLRCFDSSPIWFSGAGGLRVLLPSQAIVLVDLFQERVI